MALCRLGSICAQPCVQLPRRRLPSPFVPFSVEAVEGGKGASAGRAVRYALAAIRNVGVGAMEAVVAERKAQRTKPPRMYQVLMLNDDYTPMDFVVVVLQTVFGMTREKATRVMLQVHREGMGVCGTYTREVAAAKVEQVIDLARRHQHPLQCTMEKD